MNFRIFDFVNLGIANLGFVDFQILFEGGECGFLGLKMFGYRVSFLDFGI